MGFNHEVWLEEFRPKLGMTQRWEAFSHLTRVLSRLDKGLIVETGCIQKADDWAGAGSSTLVWEWIANDTKRAICVKSIDKDPFNAELAKKMAPNIEVHCIDSIAWLRANQELLKDCNLLYLDSHDYREPLALSELHAVGELAAAWEALPSGCWVAIDDCTTFAEGKHVLVKAFFDRLRLSPEVKGYITVWRKP